MLLSLLLQALSLLKTIASESTIKTVAGFKYSAQVVTSAHAHVMYWVVWGIAEVPTAAWYGWGMLDTMANGALPDVASIPPGLYPFAMMAWENLFPTTAAGVGLSLLHRGANILEKFRGR